MSRISHAHTFQNHKVMFLETCERIADVRFLKQSYFSTLRSFVFSFMVTSVVVQPQVWVGECVCILYNYMFLCR